MLIECISLTTCTYECAIHCEKALIELDGEYAIAEARATAAVQRAQADQLAAAEMVGHSSSGSTTAASIASTTAPQVGNPAPGPRTSAADLSFVSSPPPAPVARSALRNSRTATAVIVVVRHLLLSLVLAAKEMLMEAKILQLLWQHKVLVQVRHKKRMHVRF